MPLVGRLAGDVDAARVREAEHAQIRREDDEDAGDPQPQLRVAVDGTVSREALRPEAAHGGAPADERRLEERVVAPNALPARA